MNEMETVQQAVIVLSETLEEAEKKMSEAEPVLQKAAVAGMLYGIYGERDRMPECFQKGGGTRCYLAAGIRTESGEGMETLQLLMGRMRSEEFDGVILGRPYVPETTAVFCFLAGKILEITDTLENLAAQFWRETGKNMQIFLSDPRTGTEELKHAYWETRIVSALAERRPGKSIYLYDALLTDKRKEPDSFTELLRKLEMGILSENVDGLAALSSQFALEDGSCLAGWRVNVVLATMMGITANHVGDPLTVKKLNQKISVKMEEFAESKAYGTLGKVCAEYCLDMIEALIKKEGTEGDRMRMEVLLQYIHQHAVSEEFSLSAMAEHFRLSPSWLSHYFSNNMHMTLIEYVNRLKMDVAKDMLKDSDIGLDELAKNLGYASTSSFIRSFKNIVGMTPGKYRKIGGRK